ncbi:MAG: ATP-binding protein [Candidatus Carbobacillus altaicus]|uniref:Helicase loader DnaI n=1 Tax=Candidatus Carbonibacillus altaicus TaxID=2163959 RepID=A0A2R6XZR4_9BACL|nr:ATP-binding protein [Candidatus Carbobacillus altaicus]PTQ55918.1 MAG: Helicase loader DnaI [Candidatus Carbobacillus altaicus]
MLIQLKAALEKLTLDQHGRARTVEMIMRELENDADVKAVLQKTGWPVEALKVYATDFLRYQQEAHHCANCPGLEKCPNAPQGHRSRPYVDDTRQLFFTYEPCSLYLNAQDMRRRVSLFQTLQIPTSLAGVRFRDIKRDEHNVTAIRHALKFVSEFDARGGIGLYVYGPFGVGKTYLMAAIAGHLVDRGRSVFFVHMPALFRELKAGLDSARYLEMIRALETVDLLILDDIGAEQLTPWARDEVLVPLLTTRTTYLRPILYTSNLPLEGLSEHFSETVRGDLDRLKAFRLIERIRSYTETIMLDGPNRRRKT